MKKLEQLNASIAVLNQKITNIHFNYKGDDFRDIHLYTEELYKIGLDLYDDISEKIAMRNLVVKASFSEHLAQSKIVELKGTRLSRAEVSKTLVDDLTTIIELCKEVNALPVIQPLLDEIYMAMDKYRWIFNSIV